MFGYTAGLPVEKKFLALISGPMIAVMQLPSAPSAGAVSLRGDTSAADADPAVERAWVAYPLTAAAAGVASPGTGP